MTPDFNEMSIPEIKALIANAEKAITQKKSAEKDHVLEEMKTLAKERGFDFSDFVGGKKQRKKIEAKYRNTDDAEQTWSGMGRKPNWLVAALESGKSLEDFKI
tara:strand:+ start:2774 stop:3082 length:309 start_codon:yes stop_codon:yes gene_type:complete